MIRLITCFLLFFSIFFTLITCSTVKPKTSPEYNGVAPEVQYLNDEYINLAHSKGIYFDKTVTVGFKDINEGDTIGKCHYADNFREIDLDKKYWKSMTETQKMTVLYHEFSHCYCGRDHDYGNGIMYTRPEGDPEKEKVNGYYEDGCPLSIMYPSVILDSCMNTHYADYINEMFMRCEAW